MKQAFYFLNIIIPDEEDFETFGPGLWPIVEVKLKLWEESPSGQIRTGIYELPLLYGGDDSAEFLC